MVPYMHIFVHNFTYYSFIFCYFAFASFNALDARNGEWCHHCDCVKHRSDKESCLRSGRAVVNCNYPHLVAYMPMVTGQEILNASDENALLEIVARIKALAKDENIFLDRDKTFNKTVEFYISQGLPIQRNHVRYLRNLIDKKIWQNDINLQGRALKKPKESFCSPNCNMLFNGSS